MGGERLRSMLAGLRTDLDRLAVQVRRSGADRDRLERLSELRRASDRALSESLALVTGALAREFGLDRGRCAEADRFIALLARRLDRRLARPTVPAEQEYLHRAADVIRRRTPDYGIWDLPVMAHEFAHVLVNGLLSYDAVDDLQRRRVAELLEGRPTEVRRQAEELFCDVFACFAVGPAYACCLVMHRLDPSAAAGNDPRRSHPSDAARVHACLRTLRRMNTNGPSAGWFGTTLWRLDRAWSAMQADADPTARLDEDQRAALDVELVEIWAVLEGALDAVRFPAGNGVDRIMDDLDAGRAPRPGHGAIDLLNAAWVSRMQTWSSGASIADDELAAMVARSFEAAGSPS
jgi:hypothetical protein